MSDALPLTKAIMDSWNPWDMAEPSLTTLATDIRENSVAAHSTVDQMPSTSWGGQARDAANWRAADQASWAKKVADGVDDLQVALTDAAEAISTSQAVVNGALLGATLQRCFLISDTDPTWAMRYVPKEDDDLTPAQIAERERQMTSFVKSKADELATTAADHAALIKGAVDALGIVAPPSLTISAQDGRRDAGMAESGWTDEEAAFVGRNLRAAGLTEDQIQRLLNGEKLTDVPVGVQEYLHMFYGNLNSDELFSLKSKFEDIGTPESAAWSQALGQGLVTLSNENVGNNTGYQYLPGWAQEWAENRASDGATLRYQDVPFAGLLGNSGGVPPGERLGTELLRRGSAGASRDIGGDGQRPEVAYGAFDTDPDELKRVYESTIRQFLEVGTRNHESSAALLTGEYSDGTKLADYDRDATVGNLMRHDWSDHGDSAGNLVDWIRDYGGGTDPNKVKLADRAFSGLWDFATSTDGDNNFKQLMNTNSDGDATGKINPLLADAIRKASLPYLNYLGNPEGAAAMHGHPDLELTGSEDRHNFEARATRLFSVIASDDAPNGEISASNPDGVNTATQLYRDLLEKTNENATWVMSHPELAQSLGNTSAELLERGRAGIYGAQFDLAIDEGDKAASSQAAESRTEKILSSASYLLSVTPHGTAASVGIGAAAPWLVTSSPAEDVPFKLPTGSDAFGVDDPTRVKLSSSYAMFANSGVQGPAEWYGTDGKLKTAEAILKESDGDASQLDQAIRTRLRAEHPEIYGADGAAGYWDAGFNEGAKDEDLQYNATTMATYEKWVLEGDER
ncbi:TPR repeat region-containing protein [Gordonia alkanivorans]|uniref:TPR repeat domain-containing protein n=1 Tax=Gordonia alkanivorans NBRC 16433 TaxID=1027371 RepID=F9W2U2_9ACTN|nr:hypothetical protein [Gordonia alkanivorans]MDH3013785.1 hypothetical protein [Gordonia alkanivorans]GAA15181.1 hypothetical protein GOALK_131_00150 [Gordonia alkanivorans NBRC 16433]